MSAERRLKASFNFNTLLFFFFFFFFFSLFLMKKKSKPNIMEANLGQYLCAKGRYCTENHLRCIRTPLIHSDLKLKKS